MLGFSKQQVFSFYSYLFQAAWGGGLLMSRKHRHKLNGIERYYTLHISNPVI